MSPKIYRVSYGAYDKKGEESGAVDSINVVAPTATAAILTAADFTEQLTKGYKKDGETVFIEQVELLATADR